MSGNTDAPAGQDGLRIPIAEEQLALHTRVVEGNDTPAPRYEGDTLVVPVLEEVLVVERRLRVKEELHITRSRVEERYQDTVPLKAERVEVERFDEGAAPPPP